MKENDTIILSIVDILVQDADHSTLVQVIDQAETEIIRQRGYKDGRGAGTWVFDGDMADESIEIFKQKIRDGDPEALDALPTPRVGGEFADDPTWESILSDELNRPSADDGDQELYDVYSSAFSTGVEIEVLKYGEYGIGVDVGRSNLDLVIDKYAHRTGERLVKIVRPGSHVDGRLVREVYDSATGSYKDHPIPRPR